MALAWCISLLIWPPLGAHTVWIMLFATGQSLSGVLPSLCKRLASGLLLLFGRTSAMLCPLTIVLFFMSCCFPHLGISPGRSVLPVLVPSWIGLAKCRWPRAVCYSRRCMVSWILLQEGQFRTPMLSSRSAQLLAAPGPLAFGSGILRPCVHCVALVLCAAMTRPGGGCLFPFTCIAKLRRSCGVNPWLTVRLVGTGVPGVSSSGRPPVPRP